MEAKGIDTTFVDIADPCVLLCHRERDLLFRSWPDLHYSRIVVPADKYPTGALTLRFPLTNTVSSASTLP